MSTGGADKPGSGGAGGAVNTPSDFLKSIRGRPVVVKLNSGVDYRVVEEVTMRGSSSSGVLISILLIMAFACQARLFCAHYTTCYCCMNQKPKALCYDTMDERRAICPACSPKWPPWAENVTANTNLYKYNQKVA